MNRGSEMKNESAEKGKKIMDKRKIYLKKMNFDLEPKKLYVYCISSLALSQLVL